MAVQSLPCVEALTSLTSLDVCRTAISGGCLLSIAKRCRRLRCPPALLPRTELLAVVLSVRCAWFSLCMTSHAAPRRSAPRAAISGAVAVSASGAGACRTCCCHLWQESAGGCRSAGRGTFLG